jgi:hypothetical protein
MRRKGLGKAIDASKAPDFHGLQSPKDKRSLSWQQCDSDALQSLSTYDDTPNSLPATTTIERKQAIPPIQLLHMAVFAYPALAGQENWPLWWSSR